MAERQVDAAMRRALGRNAQLMAASGRSHCVDCDHPIPAARRAAAPSASRCVGCQTIVERTP